MASESRAQLRAREVARRAGVDEVKVVHIGLPDTDDDGVLVDVDATGFGMFSFTLDLEDLGVELTSEDKRRITSPSISTLPSRLVGHMRGGRETARRALYRYGAKRSGIAQRWVPWTAWEKFKEDFAHGKEMFETCRHHCIENYGSIRDESYHDLVSLAISSAKRLRSTKSFVPDDFEDKFVTKTMARFPTVEQLEALDVFYKVSISQLTSEMLTEMRRAAESQAVLAQTTLDEQLAEEQARLRERLSEVRVWEEQQSARTRLESERAEQQEEHRVKEEIRRLKRDEAQRLVRSQLDPLLTRLGEVRATIFDEAMALKMTIEERKAIPGATTTRIKTIASWFRNMNWSGDESLDNLISTLETMAGRPADSQDRSYEDVTAVLDELLTLTVESAREAKQQGRFSVLEI